MKGWKIYMNDIEELEKNIEKFKENMNDIDNLKDKLDMSNLLFQKNLDNSEKMEKEIHENIEKIHKELSAKISDGNKEVLDNFKSINKSTKEELNKLTEKFNSFKKLNISLLIIDIVLTLIILFVIIL